MNKVGIIGGFGPETTSEFMLMLISMWKENKPNTRPELLIWNSDMDENIEKSFIQNNKNHQQMMSHLIKGARILEKSGSDFLVLPCNSLHIFIDDLRKSVKIPVLSILDITASHLKKCNISKVGIIATEVTMKSNLFAFELSKNNIEMITPSRNSQTAINKMITNLVSNNPVSKNDFDRTVLDLRNSGATDILLACTDLQLIQPHNQRLGFIDTLHLLGQATVDMMLQQ